MTTTNPESQDLQPKAILAYIRDLPNLCSLAGLACTLLAIYFIILDLYPAAMIGMIWAVGFDWADGLVARRMKGRTGADRLFGGQLDLMIDVISYAVTPALLILSYGDFSPVFLPIVFVILVCGVLRLSYFSIFGLSGGSKYTGLAIDNNSIFLVFLFLFEGLFSTGAFTVVLCLSGLGLAALNVSQIKTPKLSGNPVNVVILATYTLAVTAIYGWQMW
jgi:CDP-diacylglycerol--serine O-phosphatidyltransferase